MARMKIIKSTPVKISGSRVTRLPKNVLRRGNANAIILH